ncbi:hypothetical protein GCM10027293_33020 [Pontibacter aydingkolensis]
MYINDSLLANPAKPTINVSINKNEVMAGELIKISVEIISKPDVKVKYYGSGDSLQSFIVVEKQRSIALINDRYKKERFNFALIGTDPGAKEIPALPFLAITPHSKQIVSTEAMPITIFLLPSDTSIPHKGILSSVPITYSIEELLPYFITVVLTMLTLLCYTYRDKLRSWRTGIQRVIFYRQSLNNLKHIANAHDAAIILPQELRNYLAGYLSIQTSASTSEEIIKELGRKQIDSHLIQKLERVLKETDNVRFAPKSDCINHQELLSISREFIISTKALS